MQLTMDFTPPCGWGGARKDAGRPRGERVSHDRRTHKKAHPVHVTVHALDDVPSLRSQRLGPLVGRHVRSVLGRRDDFRIVVFTIQRTHLHLIVEADDQQALSRGLQGFLSGLARRINRRIGRRGRLWRDRYHAQEITSPTHTRNVLRYVLQNTAHHGGAVGIDPLSSATWFDGFADHRPPSVASPVAPARTWLLRHGWRFQGLLHSHEPPADRDDAGGPPPRVAGAGTRNKAFTWPGCDSRNRNEASPGDERRPQRPTEPEPAAGDHRRGSRVPPPRC